MTSFDLAAEVALKSTALLLLALAAGALMRRSSAATRGPLWQATLVALLLLPALCAAPAVWRIPARGLELPASVTNADDPAGEPVSQRSEGSMEDPAPSGGPPVTAPLSMARLVRGLISGLAILWLGGVGLRASWLVRQVGELRRWTEAARRESSRLALPESLASLVPPPPTEVLFSDDARTPLTWGHNRPVVLLPTALAKAPYERLRAVVLHELAHIERSDWSRVLLAEAVRTLYWPHPLAWVLMRRFTRDLEAACDDRVIESGSLSATDYAAALLAIGRLLTARRSLAPALARRAELQARIEALLDRERRRGRPSRSRVASLLLSATAIVLGLASSGFARQQAPTELAPVTGLEWRNDAPTRSLGEASLAAEPSTITRIPSAPLRPIQARWSDGRDRVGVFLDGELSVAGGRSGLESLPRLHGLLLILVVDANETLHRYLFVGDGGSPGLAYARAARPRPLDLAGLQALERTLPITLDRLSRSGGTGVPVAAPSRSGVSGSILSGARGSTLDPSSGVLLARWLGSGHAHGSYGRGPSPLDPRGRAVEAIESQNWQVLFGISRTDGTLHLMEIVADETGRARVLYSENGVRKALGATARRWLDSLLTDLPTASDPAPWETRP